MRKVSRRGVAAGRAEGKSLCARLAPSSGAQGSNGIQRRKRRPRMDKHERGFRLRGSGNQNQTSVRKGRLQRFETERPPSAGPRNRKRARLYQRLLNQVMASRLAKAEAELYAKLGYRS